MKLGIRAAFVALAVAVPGAVAPGPPAGADHLEDHVGPAEPARDFPPGFLDLLPVDSQSAATTTTPAWRDPRIGGWGGGTEPCAPSSAPRVPVVLVHGNSYDAGFWRANETGDGSTTNVRSRLLAAGYCPADIWAVSYTGAMGYTTFNEVNVADLAGFVDGVRAFTGASEVDVVSHSLGVTVTRRTLQVRPDLAAAVRRHVAIAGANHGTTSCRGSGTLHVSHVCEETEPGSAWLADLNRDGETIAGVDTLVLYDPVADNFYLGPDRESPRLAGACNHPLPGALHLPVARGATAVALWSTFLRHGTRPACT